MANLVCERIGNWGRHASVAAAASTTALTFLNGSGQGNFFSGQDNVALDAVTVTTPVAGR